MESKQIPVVLIACKVFQGLFESLLPDELVDQVTYLDYGLHSIPKNLNKTLQELIDGIESPSLVVLGYGLCGNGLKGLQAGCHTLLVPRADDCIALLLGSYEDYRREFDAVPGTYYLSKGWLESGTNPLQEYQDYQKKYGEEMALWLMDEQYRSYRRVAFVAQDQADLEQYRTQAIEIAHFCERWGMQYVEILGTGDYLRRLIKIMQYLDANERDFVIIPPGSQLQQSHFLRIE